GGELELVQRDDVAGGKEGPGAGGFAVGVLGIDLNLERALLGDAGFEAFVAGVEEFFRVAEFWEAVVFAGGLGGVGVGDPVAAVAVDNAGEACAVLAVDVGGVEGLDFEAGHVVQDSRFADADEGWKWA